jgi:hypothetical protein
MSDSALRKYFVMLLCLVSMWVAALVTVDLFTISHSKKIQNKMKNCGVKVSMAKIYIKGDAEIFSAF